MKCWLHNSYSGEFNTGQVGNCLLTSHASRDLINLDVVISVFRIWLYSFNREFCVATFSS